MLEPTKVAVQPKYNRKILVKESNPENFMVQNEEHILTHLKTACFHMFSTCSPWSKLSSLRYPRQMFALHSPPCPGVTSLQVLLGSECRSDPFTMEIFNMRSWITIIKHLPSSCHSLLSTRRSHTWPYWPIPPGPRNWCQPPPAPPPPAVWRPSSAVPRCPAGPAARHSTPGNAPTEAGEAGERAAVWCRGGRNGDFFGGRTEGWLDSRHGEIIWFHHFSWCFSRDIALLID